MHNALFHRAGERVIENGRATGALVSSDPGLVRSEVELLLSKLQDALEGRQPEALEPGPLDRLALLRLLRSEILGGWSEEEGDLAAVMAAFESTQDAVLEARRDAGLSEALSPFSRKLLREVAHMLRSPLGSIVMLTDTLREGRTGPLTDDQLRQVDIIHRAALAMAATAGDVLTLVSDDHRLERAGAFSIGEALGTVADIVRPVAEARGRTLRVGKQPDGERYGPGSTLREVLLGLTLRATLHARGGEVELAAAPVDGDVVRFEVTTRADPHGREADADRPDLLKVFRVDADAGSFTLSPQGLGMAAARDMLALLGSAIDIESGPAGQHRITFRMELPRV